MATKSIDIVTNYEDFFHHAPCGFLSSLPNGFIISANSTMLHWLDTTHEQVVGKSKLTDFLSMGNKIYFETHYKPLLLMHGNATEISLEIVSTKGIRRPVLINTTVSKNTMDGSPIWQSTIFDITQRKLYEHELLLAKKSAEALMDDLQAKNTLLESQKETILQQNAKLEELSKLKSKFFGIVAHDLKSPLNSLKSYSILMRDYMESITMEQLKAMSGQMQVSLDHTLLLADNLITWAQVQMKESVSRPEVVNLKDTVRTILAIYQLMAAKKNIALINELHDKVLAFGDSHQIAFIIRNLVNNAIKFTGSGGSVTVALGSPIPEMVEITIADNGMGMSEALRENLFTSYEIASMDGTEGEKGTGLGLMLCQEFAKSNGGSIRLMPSSGYGTVFLIQLKRG